ncbi:phosphonate C-P lyase system protein PhnH [Arcobacter sp. FWKO B]|uniref:phosphonate C-P lyase system protein PhnH n=1 Tax=Arcobacter sp. FWKO B TaxID=2593672 RepID=UPI0018A63A14|nr:phosphonate C-P lyase system protein PhnH [Arcobacter sp. FWKO B]QOG12344.1 phosphonate C-P lyase system protein PhnH [Arcobacter sp. FWKO B]
MNSTDIEKNNRETFRVLLNALSMPGNVEKVNKIFNSYTLSIASTLLYSEVSYINNTEEEFTLIDAITNAKQQNIQNADYVFCCSLDGVLNEIKKGSYISPEDSATIIYLVNSFEGLNISLKGPGIDKEKKATYPIDEDFVYEFNKRNKSYPLGNEIYFLNKTNGEIKALSRTTKLEVV